MASQPAGSAPRKREHGLVRVAREQHGGRAAPEHAHQLHLLRVEILRVVDDEVAHPLALGREQLGIGRERVERGRHQLGGVQRGRGGLRRAPPRRAPQQRDLLVAAEEPPRRGPLGDLVPLPELGQLVRAEPPLGGPQQQLAQLGGEARHRHRGRDPLRPARARDDARRPRRPTGRGPPRPAPRSRAAAAAGRRAGRRAGGARRTRRSGRCGPAPRGCVAPSPAPRRDQPLPQLRRGPTAADQHERARGSSPARQPPRDGGEQQRGLARARAADDPQRARRRARGRAAPPRPRPARAPGGRARRTSEGASAAVMRGMQPRGPRQFRARDGARSFLVSTDIAAQLAGSDG